MKNKWIYIIAGVVLLALIGAFTIYYFSTGDYVATVAGEKITKPEYNFFLKNVKAQMETTAGIKDEESRKLLWESKKDGKSAQDIAKEQAIDTAKKIKIQVSKAKQSNITLDKTELDGIKTSVDNNLKSAGTPAEAEKVLKEYGVTRAELENIIKEYTLARKFADAETKKVQVSDEEVKKYYDDNKNDIDQVTVKHILIPTVDSTSQNPTPLPQDKIDAAKKKAEEILAKVKAGGDFVALAKEFSEDPGSKDKGGEYTFGKGQMMKEFEDWSFNAKAGDTGIVQTSYGFHVMKFEKRTTFDDVKDAAKSGAQKTNYSKQLEEWDKDQKYKVIMNQKVYDSVKVIG